ncbi:flavin-dependent dehydrogenase [Allosediminivita pacifica]|uniref:Flavin-dependent dehydrogenase n=2 Tax=Allosediminivita pacifica TaxID=1267769 RepID=A0A2T6ABY3_9RHOB|nr:flavin-dependent dehydrogenase [Allosediminivita pacifica]
MVLAPGSADSKEKAIEIVGAGPAGLVCAIVLAKANRRVVVREWHQDVGHRFHDDFQGLENWSATQNVLDELADAGVAADFDHRSVTEGIVFDSHAKAHRVHGSKPLFYLLRRGTAPGTLDRALLDQARTAGAEVRFNDRVKRTTSSMILAGGPRRADIIAVGYVFETSMADGAWLAFGTELAPKGYAYLLVHRGRGTVASCMFSGFRDQAKYLGATVEYFKRHAGLEMNTPRGFGGFGNVRLPRTAMQAGNPVIGEHAGFQDALAGFGLRYAMRSGRLAAQSLISGADYTKAWREALQPDLRGGVVNRYLFNQTGPRGIDYLIGKLGSTDTGDALGQAYRLSFPKRLLLPLARFHYRNPLRDRSCSHNNCDCVWCQHGTHEIANT